MLTPEDVLNTSFTQTQFREGYDERQVDDYLDDVVEAMRHLDDPSRPQPRRRLTSDDVRAVRLTTTRYRRGYDMGEVDTLLEQVAVALAEREGGARPTSPPLDRAWATSDTARRGLGSRLLGLLRGDPRP